MSVPPPRAAAAALALVLLVAGVAGPPPAVIGGESSAAGRTPREAVFRFLTMWWIADYDRMHAELAAADGQHYTRAGLATLYRRFDELTGRQAMRFAIGSPSPIARPPEPRPPDRPAPAVTIAGLDPNGVVLGPVPALAVPVRLWFVTERFGEFELRRAVELTPGPTGWQVRWTPASLFSELGTTGGSLVVEAGDLPTRGRILAADGTVLAQTRADGARVYPQDALAGQTVGFATPLTADEAAALPAVEDYRAGQLVGRRGVEAGAEALLRGRAALTLFAVPPGGQPTAVLERPAVGGADVTLTIRPALQRAAEAALAGYAEAATAVVDPASGDIWALASAPALNPNVMTIGTTIGGATLPSPTTSQLTNHATESAYPTGSSFKPFTLAAALQTGVASPSTRMSCLPTWTLQGFTFHNYLDHQLAGLVSLEAAMAFSCNTTYMPLSMLVYEHDPEALTRLIADFGFGQPTGVGWVAETGGLLPDADWFRDHPRRSGGYAPFGPFDQVQLAIGQGEFGGTQLQMGLAYAAFANRGTLWQPRLVTTAITPDGDVRLSTRPAPRLRIDMTRADLDYLVTALEAVTTYSYGTGTAAFAGFGTPVAGKSGTAETGGPDPNALFPAFAPADAPRIVVTTILVRVHLATGGSDAAPVVRRVMAAYFGP